MSERAAISRDVTSLIARLAGTQSAIEVRISGKLITGVDDVLNPGLAVQSLPFVAPGFIDLQVNGFAGVDYNDPAISAEQLAGSLRTMCSTGVTRCFPTIITGSEERMVSAMRNLDRCREELESQGDPVASAIAGLHIEGPHISREDGPRGAHPIEHVRAPDVGEFDRWQSAAGGLLRLVTVSPEWEGTNAYISHAVRSGVAVSVGHTSATRQQIVNAAEAGATMSTHLGNAAHATLPKTENYIWNQLSENRLAASFVADGIHVPADFLRSAIRAKGVERSILVTDAVMPAMCAPGDYQLGQVAVRLREDGSVVLRGGTRLAGSALRMDRALGNAMSMADLSLREALAMATVNPARSGRIAGRQRGLTPGEKSDFVLFSWDERTNEIRVETVLLGGQVVYQGASAFASAIV